MFSKSKRTVLLVRLKRRMSIASFARLSCEPLELEYLYAVASGAGWQSEIYDGVVSAEPLRGVLARLKPDVVAFSGYITAEDSIIRHAAMVKHALPQAVVVAGGVHAAVNHERFHKPHIDLIIRADETLVFRTLLETGVEAVRRMPGVCHADSHGAWICNDIGSSQQCPDVRPNRAHFEAYRKKFRYLDYGPTAIVKGSYGCPHQCSFCFCRLLNNGKYSERPLPDLLDEITEIAADTIWIVDDSFLLNKERVLEFCDEVEHRKIRKKFIVYGRADFVAANPEILSRIRAAGIIDLIVGLEAVDEDALREYRKQVTAEVNATCVRLLEEAGIRCTGLFIVSHNATRGDFRSLDRWISRTGLRVYTLSIFTPFPGTDIYEQYRDQLTTTDCTKWDLLHLVLQPGNMSRLEFYLRFYLLQAKVLFRYYRKRNSDAASRVSAAASEVAS
jgi:radical SAM superfamily enzyme YgiQ (UPF0313 family)